MNENMKHVFFTPDYGSLIRSLIIIADIDPTDEKIFVITLPSGVLLEKEHVSRIAGLIKDRMGTH